MIKVFNGKRCIKDCNSISEALLFVNDIKRIGEFKPIQTKDGYLFKTLEGVIEIKNVKRNSTRTKR